MYSVFRPVGTQCPEPERATDWGEADPLSVMASAALRLPVFAGLSAMLTMQVAAGARVGPQVLSSEKEAASVPDSEMAARLSMDVPALVIVTLCDGEVVPTAVEGKTRLVALR